MLADQSCHTFCAYLRISISNLCEEVPSWCAWHRLYPYVNIKSILQHVQKECLILGHLLAKSCWADSCSFIIQVKDISSNYSITLVMFRCGESKLYQIGCSTFILMPCDWNQSCILAYPKWLSSYLAGYFDCISASLDIAYGAPKSVGYQWLIRIMAGPIMGLLLSLPRLYHGAPMLSSLSCEQLSRLKVFLFCPVISPMKSQSWNFQFLIWAQTIFCR